MSNIDNASQTNQSMILHQFIMVDINENQISNRGAWETFEDGATSVERAPIVSQIE
jgi:hypothetical protein